MGSDRSPVELFEAVHHAAKLHPTIQFTIILTERALIEIRARLLPNIKAKIAQDAIEMNDDPLRAVRNKKSSSLLVGIRLVKKKKIDALITAGNTGALIAAASISLPKLANIKRPALLATLPTMKGPVSVLDVGGTVQCKASLLAQFASLGVDYHRRATSVPKPRFGLLNIGLESRKGTAERQEAYQLLEKLEIDGTFIGNVEGRDLFSGNVDVIVTDGFSGNILLKTAEGAASYIFESLATQLADPLQTELAKVYKKFDWMEHPGAIVIGVDGLLIKCHGSSNPKALLSGIQGAIKILSNH